jgi:predicted DNA-binding antitoxin AbrB/MazE fold protein
MHLVASQSVAGEFAMAITVEAVCEDGVLKPAEPLPLKEHARVQLTVQPSTSRATEISGELRCTDPQVIEWAAMDAELDFPPPAEEP